jgi:hypothetical protein
MNKIAIAFLAATSLAAFGCKKKAGGDMVAAYEKYVDSVCACKDTACMTKATEDYSKANAEAMKNPDPEAMKKMNEDPKYAELNKKFTDCSAKISTAGAPPAPPAEGAAAAPAGGTPPAGGTEGSAPAPAGTPPAGGAEGSGSAAK